MERRPARVAALAAALVPGALVAGGIAAWLAESAWAGSLVAMGVALAGLLAAVMALFRREPSALSIGVLVLHLFVVCLAVPVASVWHLVDLARKNAARAEEPYVDEDLRFVVRPPGEGWHLLGADDARDTSSDAAAGASHARSGALGLVFVAPLYDASLDEVAAMLRDDCDETLGEVISVRWRRRDARRFECRTSTDGLEIRQSYILATHGSHYVLLYVGGLESRITSSETMAFFRAVDLLPGPLAADSRPGRRVDARGPGWQVHDAVYEGVSAALRVELDAQTTIHVGQDVDAFDPNAVLVLGRSHPVVTLTIAAENVRGLDREQLLADRWDAIASAQAGEPVEPIEARVHGRSIELRRWRERPAWSVDQAYGLIMHGDRLLQLAFAGPTRAEPERHLRELLSSLRLLTDGEVSALGTELRAHGHVESSVGPSWALRGGVLRDFERGIVWRLPDPLWRVRGGDAARARDVDEDILFYLEHAEHGIVARLLAFEPNDPSSLHTEALLDLDVHAVAPPEPTALGETGALRSHGVIADAALACDVTTSVGHGIAHVLEVTVSPESLELSRVSMDALVSGLSIEAPSDPVTLDGALYVDRRFGFAYASPIGVTSEVLNADLGAISTSRVWTRGVASIAIVAADDRGATGSEQTVRSVERVFASQLGRQLFGTSEEHETTLGGLPARHRVLRSLSHQSHLIVARRGRTVFAVIARWRARDRTLRIERVTSGFSLLD